MSNSAESTRTVVIEKIFPHTPEKLWRALSEQRLLAQWLLSNDFSPTVGEKFQFRADPVGGWDGIIDCKVLIVEPMRQLSFTWSSLGLESVVLFTLTPTESGTSLRMEHSGFSVDQDAAYKGATYGWQNFLGKLEKLLEGGAA
jgi:uncharacterized protein YndB with AHSA1/START domain